MIFVWKAAIIFDYQMPVVAEMKLWVDANRLDPAESIDVELSSGVHVITILLPKGAKQLTGGLRLELLDVPGSSARAQMVLGK